MSNTTTGARRLNTYVCSCGTRIVSVDVDHGVTPFQLPCSCGRSMYSTFYKVDAEILALPADIEWYKPAADEVRRLSKPMREHVQKGGLVLRVVSDNAAHLRDGERRQRRR